MWYMPGEVYRENSSDDAQGYQPFITNYLLLFISFVYWYNIDIWVCCNNSKGKFWNQAKSFTEYDLY